MSKRRTILVNCLASFLTAAIGGLTVAIFGAPAWGISAVTFLTYLVVLPTRSTS